MFPQCSVISDTTQLNDSIIVSNSDCPDFGFYFLEKTVSFAFVVFMRKICIWRFLFVCHVAMLCVDGGSVKWSCVIRFLIRTRQRGSMSQAVAPCCSPLPALSQALPSLPNYRTRLPWCKRLSSTSELNIKILSFSMHHNDACAKVSLIFTVIYSRGLCV